MTKESVAMLTAVAMTEIGSITSHMAKEYIAGLTEIDMTETGSMAR